MGSEFANYTHRLREKRTQNESANIGVTPNNGGTTPRYNPVGPSLANVFFTTSKPPVYAPGRAVCSLVLVKSNGCPSRQKARGNVHDQIRRNHDSITRRAHEPTKTAHTPPNPPATKDFTFSAAAEAAGIGAFLVILLVVVCSDESSLCSGIQSLEGRDLERLAKQPTIFPWKLGCLTGKRNTEDWGRRVESHYHKLELVTTPAQRTHTFIC